MQFGRPGPSVRAFHVPLKIVNTSHKDITAFNIAIKETYADGRVQEHEMLEELVGKILAAKELQGDHSRGAESFRELYGDGAFHPGEVRDEQIGVQPGLTSYQAVIDGCDLHRWHGGRHQQRCVGTNR
jgi:hypothetical protein